MLIFGCIVLFRAYHVLMFKIKWSNDLYLNGLKVGGILCTSTYRLKKFNVSDGNGIVLGLNMNVLQPTMLLYM